MTLSFFRLGLLALFSALLMLSGCNSSGSDDGDSIAEQPRDPAPEPEPEPEPEPDPGPEARDTVLTPAAELVPVILVDRLANQSGQLDADIRERLFKTEPVDELAVHRVQMYCLSRLYQTELAINDALLGWRNAYPAGTDPVTWLERAAEEELVTLLADYGEHLYAAAVRPLDPNADSECAPFAADDTLPKPETDDPALNALLAAMNEVQRGARDYRLAVERFQASNLSASFADLRAPLAVMADGIQTLRGIARDQGLQRMKAALTNLSGRADGTGGSGSIPRLDAWLVNLGALDTTGMDDRVAGDVTQLFDDLLNKTGFLNWLDNHRDDIKDDDARALVFEQIEAVRLQLQRMRVDPSRQPASILQDETDGRVTKMAISNAMQRLEQESETLYAAMLDLAGALAGLLAVLVLAAGLLRHRLHRQRG